MLSEEVPDDLRKDLLWERKTNRIAPVYRNPSVLALGGPAMRPLTTIRTNDEVQEREARERYEKMRTKTWNGVIYQRPVW